MSNTIQNLEPSSTSRVAATPDSRPLAWWALLLLATIAFGVFANSLKNGFALDDVMIVQNNDHVVSLNWTQIWVDNYWPLQNGRFPDILYRPLTIWSYLAIEALFPGQGWAFHLGNVLLHALVTMMAAVLAQRIVGGRPIGFLTGLLFALHPIHTEVVANVVGRAELLSTVFSLAALLVFLPTKPLFTETTLPRRSFWHGLLVGVCFFLALLCKETPAAMFAAFPLIDLVRYFHIRRSAPLAMPSLFRWMLGQGAKYYAPMLAFFAIYLVLRYNACGMLRAPDCSPLVNPIVDATPIERLVTPFALLAKYLQLTAWPKVLSADYSYPSLLPVANPLAPLPLVGILLTALALIASVMHWRKAPYVAVTVGLFAFCYGIVSNFLPIGTIMGERLFYLPSLFVLMIAAIGGWKLFEQVHAAAIETAKSTGDRGHVLFVRVGSFCILTILCGAMIGRSLVRNTDWESNFTLAFATARDNPESAKACFWAGTILAAPDAPPQFQQFGRQLLERAVELYPIHGPFYFELAKVHRVDGDLAGSALYLAQAARYSAGKDDVLLGLESIIPDMGIHDPELYLPELADLARMNPNEPAASFALALAYRAVGNLDGAEAACLATLAADPNFHEAACQLALVNCERGRDDHAIHMLVQYTTHIAGNAGARMILAHMLLQKDPARHPEAFAAAERYIREAEGLMRGNPSPLTRELRTQLAQKRSAANPVAHAGPDHAMAPALAATGGQP